MPKQTLKWKAEDGTVISVPALNTIPGGLIRKHRKLEDIDMLFTLIEAVAEPAELAKIDALLRSELNEFLEAWQTHGDGATIPES